MTLPKPEDLVIRSLGECRFPSPLQLGAAVGEYHGEFMSDAARIRFHVELDSLDARPDDLFFERAGPRERLFFDPTKVKAAIVTCGGLCPGLNNVIRSVFLTLKYNYGVPEVYGVRYGYRGLNPAYGDGFVLLKHEMIENIHLQGGTFLGSSRGPQPVDVMLDTLTVRGIDMLFCVGGDGTQRGAEALARAARERGRPLAVVGIPKTIDNDIPYVFRSFGYGTAVEKAREVIAGAHAEAKGAPNGVVIVKLMGRNAGFIAAGATTASQEVNFALIPELPFDLEPPNGFLAHLERRILSRGHAVVVVAEGAGQHLFGDLPVERDASGNIKHHDIGVYLRDRITAYFRERRIEANVRYIDPSYIIRSVPANCDDAQLSDRFARYAVHAAMAGKTDLLIGYWHGTFVHVPMPLVTSQRKQLSPKSSLWLSVLATTGQPPLMVNTPPPSSAL
ncbi:MAG: ATP-dependent 6-phosphofructokinase [Chloracidobacterium sp.]|nr:ATP-dependent 6-phosphofructokinase [Chloracidobacterium sp.]MDW8218582.1 ATP-dependent 6-phosphofructokinase [Acidobacteriota bacterium]